MSFAEKIRTLRLKNNMTQEEMAKRFSVSRSTIAGYENATKKRQPSQESLTAIANLFNVSLDYLVNDEIIYMDSSAQSFLSEDEKRLIVRYRNLSLASRELAQEQILLLEKYDINYKKQQQP